MEPITQGGSFTLERILGTVPVEPDGSAYFEVPAVRSVFFVALDEKELSVKRMQSFSSVEPGETLGCVGCHEQRVKTALPKHYKLMALNRPPSRIEPIRDVPDVFDFPRDIQPILDRHCLQCHSQERRAGGVVLSGDHGPVYSHSYTMLTATRRQVADGRNQPKSNYPPRALGSSASPLMKKLEPAHHGVQASAHEKKLVRLWIEVGAPYPGTYAALGSGMAGGYEQNQQDPRVARLATSRIQSQAIGQRCGECHHFEKRWLPLTVAADCKAHPRHLAYNLTHPEKSLMLLAPLAKSAGGFESCRKVDQNGNPTTQTVAVFTSTADPDYQKILAGIRGAKQWVDRRKRFDEPGFLPRPEWTREMIRYGALPPGTDPNKPLDVYAAERRYWESLWYKP
jgi:hypothetical protein